MALQFSLTELYYKVGAVYHRVASLILNGLWKQRFVSFSHTDVPVVGPHYKSEEHA